MSVSDKTLAELAELEQYDRRRYRIDSLKHIYPDLRRFETDHIWGVSRDVAEMFYAHAFDLAEKLPEGEQAIKAIRHLRKAKDAALRAVLESDDA